MNQPVDFLRQSQVSRFVQRDLNQAVVPFSRAKPITGCDERFDRVELNNAGLSTRQIEKPTSIALSAGPP
jgi:hypothetical protein